MNITYKFYHLRDLTNLFRSHVKNVLIKKGYILETVSSNRIVYQKKVNNCLYAVNIHNN